MTNEKKAFFVEYPRTWEDLTCPHAAERERPYQVVRTVILPGMDYRNFVSDMLADRQFIEDASTLCAEEPVFRCIQVQPPFGREAVLVVPKRERFVKWAAMLQK